MLNSVAADDLRRMVDSAVPYNDQAGRAITARSAAAKYDLSEAHAAYTRERDATGQAQHSGAARVTVNPPTT